MRTIIPFPPVRVVGGGSSTGPRRPAGIASVSTLPVSSFENSTKVPEGEPAGGALDLPPKARALHADIVGLIRAVRGRFD